MRSHSSCLFDTGQPLLVDFGLCAPIRLVFLTFVSYCWWTLTCALPLVLSFSHWSATVGGISKTNKMADKLTKRQTN